MPKGDFGERDPRLGGQVEAGGYVIERPHSLPDTSLVPSAQQLHFRSRRQLDADIDGGEEAS